MRQKKQSVDLLLDYANLVNILNFFRNDKLNLENVYRDKGCYGRNLFNFQNRFPIFSSLTLSAKFKNNFLLYKNFALFLLLNELTINMNSKWFKVLKA